MKVWVVLESDYDGAQIIGVYDSEEKATAKEAEMYAAKEGMYSGLGWYVEQWEVR